MKSVLCFAILCVIAVAIDSYRYKRDDLSVCDIPGYCLPGWKCVDSKCIRIRIPRHCKTSDDCFSGMPCISGICATKESRQQHICTTTADCKLGYRCIGRECMPPI